MSKCIMCETNDTKNIPAVCDGCREAKFPPKPEVVVPAAVCGPPTSLNVYKPSINLTDELRKVRDTIDRILTNLG